MVTTAMAEYAPRRSRARLDPAVAAWPCTARGAVCRDGPGWAVALVPARRPTRLGLLPGTAGRRVGMFVHSRWGNAKSARTRRTAMSVYAQSTTASIRASSDGPGYPQRLGCPQDGPRRLPAVGPEGQARCHASQVG